MKDILEIASKHLGKAGDGSVVKPYETPKSIDSSLLVAIPRNLNRDQHDIVDFGLGFDVWNAYEFSCLCKSNAPFNAIVTLKYPADSEYIVESKSLKLYLNSFNMDVINVSYDKVSETVTKIIEADLSSVLETEVIVNVCKPSQEPVNVFGDIHSIDNLLETHSFSLYDLEQPDVLQVVENDGIDFYTSILRSNCRVTNQPDWGDIFVSIKGEFSVDKASFLQYILSLRNENHFHEEIVELVYKRLTDLLPSSKVCVLANYTRRGGIDINPIRSNSTELLETFSSLFSNKQILKTPRQ